VEGKEVNNLKKICYLLGVYYFLIFVLGLVAVGLAEGELPEVPEFMEGYILIAAGGTAILAICLTIIIFRMLRSIFGGGQDDEARWNDEAYEDYYHTDIESRGGGYDSMGD
jgi:uncharacterized membrane protein